MLFKKKKVELSKTECLALSVVQWCILNSLPWEGVKFSSIMFTQLTVETGPLDTLKRMAMHLYNLGLTQEKSLLPLIPGSNYKAIRIEGYFIPVGKTKCVVNAEVLLKECDHSGSQKWSIFGCNVHTQYVVGAPELNSFRSLNYYELYPYGGGAYKNDDITREDKFVKFCKEFAPKVFAVE